MNAKHPYLFLFGVLYLGLILAIVPSVYAQGPSDSELAVDALVLVDASTDEAMEEAVDFIQSRGGSVPVTFAPHVLLVRLPPEGSAGLVGQARIVAVYTGPVDAATIAAVYGDGAGLAARVWNTWLISPAIQSLPSGITLQDDVLLPPSPPPDEIIALDVPQWYQTSEYLYGSVQTDLFLPESNGSLDPNSENWSTSRRDQVVSEVTAGITWWAATATQGGRPSANLSFNITVHDRFNEPATVATRYEPIRRSSDEDYLWIEEIMGRLGYSQSAYTAVQHYANDRRASMGRNWGFVIFVVDSLNDSDGTFSNGRFGYAYLNGPYIVMTYDNDGWGIANMEMVTAHEMAHTFGALDEYASSGCRPSDRSGYLDIANTNCENGNPTEDSIMRNASSQSVAYPNHLASVPIRGMVGWRDSDSDGLYDPVDTTPSLALTPYTPDPTASNTPVYSGSTEDVPYPSPTRTDASINTITAVQYRVDGGTWQSCSPADGSFNAWREAYTCSVGPLSDGSRTIQVRSRNSVGNYSTLASDVVTVDTTPPTNPTTANPGCAATNNTWQNTCYDPAFTWSAATDATTGVAGYQVYWGTNPGGTATTWITTLSYDPPAVGDGSYYLRLRSRDNVGNWSAWTTLFTLRYDHTPPTMQIIAPTTGAYLNVNLVTVEANANDAHSGVNQFQFFAGYNDGGGWNWHNLGWDTNGSDGWSRPWDASAVADQSGVAFYVYAWDNVFNLAGKDVSNIILDRTPPTSAAQPLPATLGSTTFILNWSGSDALAGLDTYDIQYRDGPSGTWTDLWTSVPYSYTSGWFTGQMGHTYYFRVRARDRASNQEAYPGGDGDTHVFIQTCTSDSYEEDDTYQSATWVSTDGTSQTHTFCGPGDQDWLAFQASAGWQYVIETSNLPYWTDTYLYLYDTDGQTLLDENDDIVLGINRASRLEWTAPADGTYYVMLRDWNSGTSGNAVTYDISIRSGFSIYLPLVLKGGIGANETESPATTLPPPKSQGLILGDSVGPSGISVDVSSTPIPPPRPLPWRPVEAE